MVMKLKNISFESLHPETFWPVYHNTKVAILAIHAEKWAMIKREKDWGSTLSDIDVFIGDGVGLLLGYWFLTGKVIKKCSGVDLINTLIEQYPKTNVYLWGARADVVARAAESYKKQGLSVVGIHDGYSGDPADIIKGIKESKAKLVFVGNEGKTQAELVARVHKELDISALSVGGSFDVAGGGLKRAPRLFQKIGLEWFWRMLIEPRRFKRLPNLFLFVWYVMMEKIGLSK